MIFSDHQNSSFSEMKLKLLYSILQSDDFLVKLSLKISLLTYFGNALEREDRFPRLIYPASHPCFSFIYCRVFDYFANEEMKWQQNDSTHDLNLQLAVDHNTSISTNLSGSPSNTTNRRKIVSFCKYLCRIFDSTISPLSETDYDNPQLVLTLIDETTLLLEYKYRILLFMNRLIQIYGKRAVECFLGSSITKPTTTSSSRRHSSSIGFKQVPFSHRHHFEIVSTDPSFYLPSLCDDNPSS